MQRIVWMCVALFVGVAPASAGMITAVTAFPGPSHGFGPGMGFLNVPLISTPNPNNDDQPGGPGGDNNIVVPLKRFDFPGYIDIEFHVTSTGGVTEYRISESVDNDTGVDWAHYRMELGYGVGAAFVRSTAADQLDFDAGLYTPAPTSTAFPIVSLSPDALVFTGGVHSTGVRSYIVRIDVPDLPDGRFTLRQIPIIPEPATLALAASGTVAIFLAGIRRRRRTRP